MVKFDLRIYVLVQASSLTNGDWCCCEELEIGHSTKTLRARARVFTPAPVGNNEKNPKVTLKIGGLELRLVRWWSKQRKIRLMKPLGSLKKCQLKKQFNCVTHFAFAIRARGSCTFGNCTFENCTFNNYAWWRFWNLYLKKLYLWKLYLWKLNLR